MLISNGKIDLKNASLSLSNVYDLLLNVPSGDFIVASKVIPQTTYTYDLGSSSYVWRNLYLSSDLTNGTESYNIQDSYNLLFGKYTENNAMTELDYTQYCIIQLSADRTFTLKSANYGCFPEYHFKVENTSSSAVTLTFPNNTVILTNDEDNVVVSSNTISLAGNTTIECSLVGLNLVAINFEVQ